jgi:hypothetical protein
MNPELRRNLWLQLSAQRLIAAPVVLGVLFTLTWMIDPLLLRRTAEIVFYLMVGFWGTRRAADSLAEEVAGGTWDGQRLSSLGAGAMVLGKLVGATAFAWYCGLMALAVGLRFGPEWPDPAIIAWVAARFVAIGLLGHTVALLAVLAFRRKLPGERRLPVAASQVLGLLAIFGTRFITQLGGWPELGHQTVGWFGFTFWQPGFLLASTAAFALWALLGCYRLMRVELQFRAAPWVWLAFVLFVIGWAEGLAWPTLLQAPGGPARWLILPAVLAGGLTYVALFAERKDPLAYRALGAALAGGAVGRAWTLLPLWLPTYLLFAGLALALAVTLGDLTLPAIDLWAGSPLALAGLGKFSAAWPMAAAAVLFLLRDILFVLWLNATARRRRADLAAFIYLAVAYGPLAGLAVMVGATPLLSFLVPVSTTSPLQALLPVALELLLLVWLLRNRWASAGRALRPRLAG